MKNQSVLIGIIGLLTGVIIAGATEALAVNNNNTGMMQMMGMNTSMMQQGAGGHDEISMMDMSKQLEGLSGDAFDKAYLEMMIAHHEGAIDMAKLAPTRAKHDEIKTVSTAIISAQNKEISDMKQWQNNWAYTSDDMMNMTHGN